MRQNNDKCKHWGTIGFYLLMIVSAMFLIAQTCSSKVGKIVLKQFHLRQNSFLTFSVVHFIPPMYSFTNEVWYAHTLTDFEKMRNNPSSNNSSIHFWFNHYPLRFVTFSIFSRKMFFQEQKPQYVYVQSKYNDLTLRTIYELIPGPQGLMMKRVEKVDLP